MKYLIDSNILIDHFRGIENATEFIIKNYNDICISPITYAEVMTGFSNEYIFIAKSYLNIFPFITIEPQDASLAAEMRRLHKIKLPDAFQAALSQNRKLFLVTRNTKDFSSKRFSFVHTPYQLP